MPPIDFDSAVQHALQAANDPGSHTELDASTFHPSQMAMCRRQAFLSKLGLKDMTDALGYFQPGTLIHEFLEEQLRDAYPDHWFEYPVHHETGGVTIVGHTDCYDHQRGIVYDVKTRGGWHRFDPPKDRHLDQVHAYMAALGAEKAQIVYISKKNLAEVRPWPAWDGDTDRQFIQFDHNRWDDILQRAQDIQAAIERDGVPTDPADIPFQQCGCFPCQQETLDLPDEPASLTIGDDAPLDSETTRSARQRG